MAFHEVGVSTPHREPETDFSSRVFLLFLFFLILFCFLIYFRYPPALGMRDGVGLGNRVFGTGSAPVHRHGSAPVRCLWRQCSVVFRGVGRAARMLSLGADLGHACVLAPPVCCVCRGKDGSRCSVIDAGGRYQQRLAAGGLPACGEQKNRCCATACDL